MNRWQQLQEIGCLACRKMGFFAQPSDCHHLLSGHKRRGDEFTIPLCPWHHRGVWNDRFQNQKMAGALLGPSLAHESKRFREMFGSDEELLFEANRLIAEHQQRATGWKPEPSEIDENGHLVTKKPPDKPPTRRRTPAKSKG
jgi:hypothetical protein